MDGEVIIGTKIDTKKFDRQIDEIQDKLFQISEKLSKPQKFGLKESDMAKLTTEAEKLNNKLFDLIKKRDELTGKSNFENIGNGLEKVTRKVGKWALAVFSVRSAYMLVRKAVNTLAQDNEQLATDIKFIQYAMAEILKPVIEFLVRAVYKLISFINEIYTKIFGTALFTQEMVDNFNKSNKSANKLKKTLAGFDEMNILNDDGSTGVLNKISPSIALDNSTKNIDNWMTKISKKFYNLGDEMSKALSNPQAFSRAYGVWDKFIYGIVQSVYGIYEAFRGLIDAVSSIGEIIYGIFTGDINLIKIGLSNFVKSIGTTLNGIVDVCKGISTTIFGIFKVGLSAILNGLSKGIKDIKKVFNTLPSWLKTLIKGMLNTAISMINILISGINAMLLPLRSIITLVGKVMGKNWTLQSVSIPKIPYLAKGGIVNMPSRGVPVGSALAGERGAEGVIPLTDSQQMALLGEAIGKYITINATINNTMNGRVISREIQKIQNQSDFAMNR